MHKTFSKITIDKTEFEMMTGTNDMFKIQEMLSCKIGRELNESRMLHFDRIENNSTHGIEVIASVISMSKEEHAYFRQLHQFFDENPRDYDKFRAWKKSKDRNE